MKTHTNLYWKVYSIGNLILAWRKARKGKTRKEYVTEFEKDLIKNLLKLHYELKNKTYKTRPLKTFILRDPKTRKISKSHFRDRIVHHALCNIIEPIFNKTFIYDSCANRIGKGGLFGVKRFQKFFRKVSNNGVSEQNRFRDNNYVRGYCLKADIRHYFEEVNHNILIRIISRKIRDKEVMRLIDKIVGNVSGQIGGGRTQCGMPLGNLTSQFFANVYLNELDYFVKHDLKAKYYIRYVDDFVILHRSKRKLKNWKIKIEDFLKNRLKLELHPQKSRIFPISRGIDFVGFRNFYNFRLLRKRNIRKIRHKINLFGTGKMGLRRILDSYQGWQAYAMWANTHELQEKIKKEIIDEIWNRA